MMERRLLFERESYRMTLVLDDIEDIAAARIRSEHCAVSTYQE